MTILKGEPLQTGDYIQCQGMTVQIDVVKYCEPYEWRNAYYIEFVDTNGVYRSWHQDCDGGLAFRK